MPIIGPPSRDDEMGDDGGGDGSVLVGTQSVQTSRRPRASPHRGSLEGVIPGLADRFDVLAEALDRIAAAECQRAKRERRNRNPT